MKTKIKNTNLWIDFKLEKPLQETLSYYNEKSLYKVLLDSQIEKITKILELEKLFQSKYKSKGYLYIPRIVEKEPNTNTENFGTMISFFVEELYPVITDLKKELLKDKRDVKVKSARYGEHDLQNVFWNINNCLNKFQKGKKFLEDIHKGEMELELSGGSSKIESYVNGMKGYICGNGISFIAGDGTMGHIGNAKLYESLELAQKKQPSYGIFEVEIKLVSPSLTRKCSEDENIKTLIIKEKIEKNLPLKEEVTFKSPKI